MGGLAKWVHPAAVGVRSCSKYKSPKFGTEVCDQRLGSPLLLRFQGTSPSGCSTFMMNSIVNRCRGGSQPPSSSTSRMHASVPAHGSPLPVRICISGLNSTGIVPGYCSAGVSSRPAPGWYLRCVLANQALPALHIPDTMTTRLY